MARRESGRSLNVSEAVAALVTAGRRGFLERALLYAGD